MALHMNGELRIELASTWGQTIVNQPYRRWIIRSGMRPIPVWNPVAHYEINLHVDHTCTFPPIAFFVGHGELLFEPTDGAKGNHGAYVIPQPDIRELHHRLTNVLTFLSLQGWSLWQHTRRLETALTSDAPLVFLPMRYPVQGHEPGDLVEEYRETITRSWDLDD